MGLMQINDTVTVDDLVRSYLRYKDWMDHDTEHSAYCAMDIILMQVLFGTTCIKVPPNLVDASYEELLACMEKRQVTLAMFIDAAHESIGENETDHFLSELEMSTFKSEVHYFTTLFEAILQTAESVRQDDEQEPSYLELDEEPLEDHFAEPDDATLETIRAFILTQHPRTEFMSFPAAKLHRMGLPTSAPPDPLR